MFSKTLAASAVIASLSCLAPLSTANAQQIDNDKDIRLGSDSVRAIADGFKLESGFSDYRGQKVLVVNDISGQKILFVFVACEDEAELTNCDGVEMRSLWTFPANGTASEIAARISDFNVSFRAAKAGSMNDTQVYLSRYIIADHGTKQGNLAIEMAVFTQLGEKLRERILQAE